MKEQILNMGKKVEFFTYKEKKSKVSYGTKISHEKVKAGEGILLEFGINSEAYEGGTEIYSVGIIETENGEFHSVPIELIKIIK